MMGHGSSLFSLYSRLYSSLCIPSGRVKVPVGFLMALNTKLMILS